MAGAIKKATGLTGLKVSTNPHYTLTSLYNKTLRALAKMPQNAAYRNYTEKIVNDRLSAVNSSNKDVKALEKTIGCGQAEELIVQAEKELMLARKMLGWKPWDSLLKQAPPNQWKWPPAENK